jgi:hypothetical protein
MSRDLGIGTALRAPVSAAYSIQSSTNPTVAARTPTIQAISPREYRPPRRRRCASWLMAPTVLVIRPRPVTFEIERLQPDEH